MKAKLQSLLAELNHGLVDRDDVIKLSLLTVLAGENLLLVGPPGTGKSLIARRIASCFDHGGNQQHYFEYLLTKFSTPEEVFGPLSIKALREDIIERKTAGYLPEARVAFLDEIFKASSSILNALLTILNERIYHNGSERNAVPLQSLIAASNELPTGQEELNALYDRFLVRGFVDYVKESSLSRLFDASADTPIQSRLSNDELASIRQAALAVSIPEPVRDCIEHIWLEHRKLFKEDRREQLSDRRLKKVLGLLRASAATNGRTEVDLSDVLLLKNCLWNHPENAKKVGKMILNAVNLHNQRSHGSPVLEKNNYAHLKPRVLRIPDIGGIEDCNVAKIFVNPGDTIQKDDSLLALETDKASMEIPATSSGIVQSVRIKVGDKVSKGEIILLLAAPCSSSDHSTTHARESGIKGDTDSLAGLKSAEADINASNRQKQGVQSSAVHVDALRQQLNANLWL